MDSNDSRLQGKLPGLTGEGHSPRIPAPDPPRDPSLPKKYEYRGLLGEGGMGVVYRAFDTSLQLEVALKMYKRDALADEKRRERFKREAQVMARFKHSSIPRIYEFGEHEEVFYLAMELIHGESLAIRLAGSRSLEPENALAIVRPLADAVAYIHEQGIIHRDIKPANIFMTPEEKAILGDFGLVHCEDKTPLTQEGAAPGTLSYMAPEQAAGKALPASDVYSLGAVFYEMLTGEQARWLAGDADELRQKIAAHCTDPNLAESLAQVCEKALARDPQKRYPNGRKLYEALLGCNSATVVDHPVMEKDNSMMNEWRKLQELLENQRALDEMKRQAAGFRVAPPEVALAIQDKEEEIEKLRREIEGRCPPPTPAKKNEEVPPAPAGFGIHIGTITNNGGNVNIANRDMHISRKKGQESDK